MIPKVATLRGTNLFEREECQNGCGYCVRKSPDEEEEPNHQSTHFVRALGIAKLKTCMVVIIVETLSLYTQLTLLYSTLLSLSLSLSLTHTYISDKLNVHDIVHM